MEINSSNPREFNLIPPQILKREERRRIRGSAMLCFAVISLLVALVWWQFPDPEELVKAVAPRRPPVLRLTASQWGLLDRRLALSTVMSQIGDAANGHVWLSAFTYDHKTNGLTLFGQGYSAEKISEFTHLFQESAALKTGKVLSFTQDRNLIRFKWEGTLP